MPGHADSDRSHHEDTSRLEAFSDGVFAIAITLLILEIAVPEVEDGHGLGAALRGLWPSYIAYGLSFVTIGIMWLNHDAMFRDIGRADHTLKLLNLFLLMCISFIPFSTAVLAAYMNDEGGRRAASVAYGVSLIFTAAAFNALWLYAARNRRLIDPHVSDERVRERTRRYLPGAPLYALGLPLALINSWVGIGLWFAVSAFFLLPPRD